VEVFHLSSSDLGERRLDAILYSRGIRGIILPPAGLKRPRLDLDWSRYAGVALGYSVHEPELHRVCPDQFQAMTLAIEQLRGRGYRRIGLYIDEDTDARVRHKFTAVMEWHNHGVSLEERVPLLMTVDLDRARFLAWLERYRPEVILCWRQVVVDWLRAAGREVPRDIGFAHVNWTERTEPCAGIDQRPRLLGAAAVDTVVALLHTNERGVPPVPRTISIESLWVDGPTTRPRP
jgi:LacI family transcriptional regulator